MQTINFWIQYHFYWKKIAFLFLVLFTFSNAPAIAQNSSPINLPDSDDKWLHFGYVIGGHLSSYKIRYSQEFIGPLQDTVQSIQALNKPGFSMGILLNFRIAKYADLMLQPKFGLYEHELVYTYTAGREDHKQLVESSIVDFPVLLKYKSVRRGNIRMFMIGGVNPSLRVNGKKDDTEEKLQVNNTNLAVEYGFGADLYYPLFKLSPEIRFSHGLINLLSPEKNIYSKGLQSLTAHSVTIYLIFSD
ncbi:MAG: PorT family protein [Bacteroidota bacterium]|nr:PorT family protein [Bacteroidota bacterium]